MRLFGTIDKFRECFFLLIFIQFTLQMLFWFIYLCFALCEAVYINACVCLCVCDAGSTMSAPQYYVHLSAFISLSFPLRLAHTHTHTSHYPFSHIARKAIEQSGFSSLSIIYTCRMCVTRLPLNESRAPKQKNKQIQQNSSDHHQKPWKRKCEETFSSCHG